MAKAPAATPGEIPAVVYQADILGRKVLPCPVQTGQFAEERIFFGDIFTGIVPAQADGFFAGGADLQGDIQGIGGYGARPVCGNDHFDIH